jgi:hypothetical protein
MKERREWDDAVSRAKKALGFSPTEFVEDWASIVAMAKGILAEGRGDSNNSGDIQAQHQNDKSIIARYLSGRNSTK